MRSFHGQRSLTSAIQIVPFRLRHLPRILRVEHASFGAEAWPRKYFLELYADCRDWFIVAKVRGRIAGYAVGCAEKRNAEIASLAVHPDYRRRGLGHAMLLDGMHRARDAGATRMTVACLGAPGHPQARGLYYKAGFRPFTLDAPLIKYAPEPEP